MDPDRVRAIARALGGGKHRRKGECQRCNDVGDYGRRATVVARAVAGAIGANGQPFPDFKCCDVCALFLLTRWPGKYVILGIVP